MERVVKGFAGYSKEKLDKPATHVIMTVDEYKKMQNNLFNAQNETRKTKENAKTEIEMYKQKTNKIIEDEKENARKVVEAFQNEFNKAKNEIDRLNDLNSNILRINKEYSNAKRGLRPKKTHSGYVALDSEQYKYNFRYWDNGKVYSEEFSCWKVRMQSPYNSTIPYKTIVKTIQYDLLKVFGHNLGIDYIIGVENFKFKDFEERYKDDKNFIFKTLYKANYKNGFWEVIYLVKNEINVEVINS